MERTYFVPQSRLLTPPEGYYLDCLVATTMSLDIQAVIPTLLQADLPERKKFSTNEAAARLAYLAEQKRCMIFYDGKKGCCCDNRIDSRLVKAVLNMCHPVYCRSVFHPKIILAGFRRKADGNCRYRLQVSSKNLTASNVFEVCMQLETEPCGGQQTVNHNISQFLSFLRKHHDSELLDRAIEELKTLRFTADQAEDVEVTFSGFELQKTQETLLEALGKDLNHVPEGKNFLILSPDYETSSDMLKGFPVYAPVNISTHAKLYCDLTEKTIWIGSSNLSLGGMRNNLECLVKFRPNAEGPFPVSKDGEDAVVFDQKCCRITESRLSEEQYGAEDALNEFIQTHKFSMHESRSHSHKFQAHIYIQQIETYAEQICPEFLPYGISETKSSVHQDADESKWIRYRPDQQKYQVTGKTDDRPCLGLLRIQYGGVERLVTAELVDKKCHPIDDVNVTDDILSQVCKDFFQADWFTRLNHKGKRDQAFEEAAGIAGTLLNSPSIKREHANIERNLSYIRWYYKHDWSPVHPQTQPLEERHAPCLPTAPKCHEAQPKFQQDAISAVLDAFANKRTRYLVADETGLGKTHIARGVLERLYEAYTDREDCPAKGCTVKPFVVYYFGSNVYLLENTMQKLTQGSKKDYARFPSIDRLGMLYPSVLLGKVELDSKKINLFSASANLFDLSKSKGNEKERELYTDCVGYLDKKKVTITSANIEEYRNMYTEMAMKGFRVKYIQKEDVTVHIKPSLIIVDEFHRYSQTLRDALGKYQQKYNIPMLMLSATPYVMYSRDFEVDQEATENENNKEKNGFESFEGLLDFLADGDVGKPDLRSIYQAVWQQASPNLQGLSTLLRGYIWRNERVNSAENKYRDLPQEEDWLSGQYDNCIDPCLDLSEKGRYFSLCPGVLSFPVKAYREGLLDSLSDLPQEDQKKYFYNELNLLKMDSADCSQFMYDQDQNLRIDYVESFLPLHLIQKYIADPGKQHLWMPPSRRLYAVKGEQIDPTFSKLLVFSGYNLVPRMLSAVFSSYICQKHVEHRKLALFDKGISDSDIEVMTSAYPLTAAECPTEWEEIIQSMMQDPDVCSCAARLGWEPEYCAMYALGSPLICAYRITRDITGAKAIASAFDKYFNRAGIADVLAQMEIDSPEKLLSYCVDHHLQAVLLEYQFCTGPDLFQKSLKTVLEHEGSAVNVAIPDEALGYQEAKVTCHFSERFSPDAEDTGASGTSIQGKMHQQAVEASFNSPFWPMILATTSVGQEGIDLDRYCSRIMHYSLPANPMAFEQQDGRVDRRRSLLARRTMDALYAAYFGGDCYLNYWDWIFSQGADESGMAPDWVQNPSVSTFRQERIIPFFPLSKFYNQYERLLRWKNMYRGKMGVPTEKVNLSHQEYCLSLNLLPRQVDRTGD